jgi:ATP-dependent RNA helicase DHX57
MTDISARCQKSGWEKPTVDTVGGLLVISYAPLTIISQRQHSDGWSFVVTLSKSKKGTSQKETVRLEPHPPRFSPTALEARHWGATYALYRVRTSMFYIGIT